MHLAQPVISLESCPYELDQFLLLVELGDKKVIP